MKFDTIREVVEVRGVDRARVALLTEALGVSEALATILVGRGLYTFEACRTFFNPDSAPFEDPFLLGQMDRAVERIRRALERHEKVTVFGDYDVDGISSTALMVRFLRDRGAEVDYYLPNRLTEGYGVSREGIDEIVSRGTSLIITVDCGIGSCDEIRHAGSRGCDVVVTDHHEPHGALPEACAVCNPKVGDYPGKNLAGVGVALKLCQGMAAAMQLGEESWSRYLELVALGTAADIVPLTGENRLIAARGYERLCRTDNEGLKALMAAQGCGGKRITTGLVVFQLAPCINAAGRLGDPRLGVKLLLTDSPAEAAIIARELRSANRQRRTLDARVQEQAIGWVLDSCDPGSDFGLVAADADWHVGVIGIAASKLVERFYRPTFLFSIGPDGIARGSARSIPGLHLLEALEECGDLLETYGGHAAAAGATIRAENIAPFRRRFNEAVGKRLSSDDLVKRVVADVEIPLPSLTPKFFKILRRMEPFGPGNMRPVLFSRELRHRYEPRLVGEKHVKMAVTAGGIVMDAIAFSFGHRIGELRGAPTFGLAFSLDENEWKGRVSLQMQVKGMAL